MQELVRRLERDIDDVLATMPLVAGNAPLVDRLFAQLVDLMLESIMLGLRTEMIEGTIDAEQYGAELAALASQCRQVGLLTDA